MSGAGKRHVLPRRGIVSGQDRRKQLLRQIVSKQTGWISAEFARQRNITVKVATAPEGAAYMYAEGQLLVVAEQADHVRNLLFEGTSPEPVEEVIPGVSLIRFGAKGNMPIPTVSAVLKDL